MNEEHPNIAVLKRFNPTNIAVAAEVLAEDAVWHYFNPKLPDVHGDYKGLEGFKTFFEKMARRTKGTFKVNPISATAIGDELVVVQTKNTLNLEDQQLEVDVVVVWRIVDGRIKEVWDIPAVYVAK
ncbi:nuclear transport factor 2 family protein [Aquimarina celericrescens]|uniref:Nuclear transport factor 2 family protein n=1 Tax=Aquimarina celericrescens TaxID=1964542 RepID=A0ABW5AUE2_9FLAO|nr:nuclear transport factor 2 family protein [Aquimarina celericrescens]